MLNRLLASQHKPIEAQDFLDQFDRNSPLAKMGRFDESATNSLLLDSGIQMTPPSALSRTSTPNSRRQNGTRTHRTSTGPQSMMSGADLTGVNSPSARSTPQSTASGIVLCTSTPFQAQSFQPQAFFQSKSNIDNAIKKARANAFFDR